MSNDRVIIIILGDGDSVKEGWTAIHNFNYPACNDVADCNHKFIFLKDGQLANNSDCDLIICKENHSNINLSLPPTKKIVAAVHNNASEINKYKEFLNKKGLKVNGFSRLNDNKDIKWNNIKPLLENIVNNNSTEYENLFNKLWEVIAPSPIDEAHALRAEILTPFTAIHLALQYSFEKNWTVKTNPLIFDSECQKACGIIKGTKLTDKLDEFLDYAEDDDKTGINKKFAELKGRVEKLCEVIKHSNKDGLGDFKELLEDKKGGNGLIEVFAMTLEKVVETVERRKSF